MSNTTVNKEELKQKLLLQLHASAAKSIEEATDYDMYLALSSLVKESNTPNWIETKKYVRENGVKQVYYFSMEFLIGKLLSVELDRMGILGDIRNILSDLGFDLDKVADIEPEAGLGNGGLGRLAACFMDSLASCGYAGNGIGIRYAHGLFKQKIVDGYQVEESDDWLSIPNVWEVQKLSNSVEVRFFGKVRDVYQDGRLYFIHEEYEPVMAIPYDIPIMGGSNGVVNTLRLWRAEPKSGDFDFESFRRGEYANAVAYRQSVRAISDALYPDDSVYENKVLRLKQEYFFVSAGLTGILTEFLLGGKSVFDLPEYVSVHINDTHPSLAVAELMRLLMDDCNLEWEEAFSIVEKTISYTNHTVMPEALEIWPSDLMQKLLPRIYQIIHELNARFCHDVYAKYPGDIGKVAKMAIEYDHTIRMANLAIVGSHSVNGVAGVHTEILKKELFKDFNDYFPGRFNNKTNGVTHRRWLSFSNPGLTGLLSDYIGDGFLKDPLQLRKVVMQGLHNEPQFLTALDRIKQQNKTAFSEYARREFRFSIDPSAIFDFQVKRIHAYKRQLMNVLRILDLYFEIKDNGGAGIAPTAFVFAGKAAPGYVFAKLIIKLINSVATLVNGDEQARKTISVYFLENYNVTMAQHIFPASDISEQISTAGKEASGTSNMKFMMNGAVTLGTMDGANIEIAEAVGPENIIICGLSVDEISNLNRTGGYRSRDLYNGNPRIKRVIDALTDGTLKDDHPDEFLPIVAALLDYNDTFFVLKDLMSYIEAGRRANGIYLNDRTKWIGMSAVNIANSGRFSSDETIRKYAREIWKIRPMRG